MDPVIVTTVGDPNANSLASLEEFDAYLGSRLNATTVLAESPTRKKQALIESGRDFGVLPWAGEPVYTGNPFPRNYLRNPDAPFCTYYSASEIPQRAKDGQCELAFQYLKAGTSDLASLDSMAMVVRKKVDVLETEYAAPSQRATGLSRFPRVLDYIRPLLCTIVGQPRLVR